MHKPVLLREVINHIVTDPEGIYVDGTIGGGGHSEELAKIVCPKGKLICLDRDPDAIEKASQRLTLFKDCIKIIRANYADLDNILNKLGIDEVNGILLDLGMSSEQIECSGRGFSFLRNEPLDMRMDPADSVKAKDLINKLPEHKLLRLIKKYGEEKRASKIVKAIIREREKKPISSSLELADIILSISPKGSRKRHPATKVFQALRIAVNKEIDYLKSFLEKAPYLLKKMGRLVIISYHSIEDRLVKNYMVKWEKPCTCPPGLPFCICGKRAVMKRINKKGIKASEEEIRDNPRSRSAILRVAERI